MKNSSFTLIEILVVATIIGLLAAGGIASYTQFNKQARDARRKADIEEIRAALEIYRSNTDIYPDSLSPIVPSYIKSIPVDPKLTPYSYDPLPGGCGVTPTPPCTSYQLNAELEQGGTYQTDPYGGTVVTSTPSPTP